MSEKTRTATLWLALLQDGTRNTVNEAAELIRHSDMSETRELLRLLVLSDAARRFEPPPGKKGVTYGITPECCVPKGVTLQDVWTAREPSEVQE